MRKQTKKVLSWVLSAAMVLSVANGASFVTKTTASAAESAFSTSFTVGDDATATLVDGTDVVSGGWATDEKDAFVGFISHADAATLSEKGALVAKVTGSDASLQYQSDWSTVELKDGVPTALDAEKLAAVAAGEWQGLALTVPNGKSVTFTVTVPETLYSTKLTVADDATATLVEGTDAVSGGWATDEKDAFVAFISHAEAATLAEKGALSVKVTGADASLQYQSDWSTIDLKDGVNAALDANKLAAVATSEWQGLAVTIPVGKTATIEFSTLPGVSEPETPVEPEEPGAPYIDEELWATNGIHAFISYQMPSWDCRNGVYSNGALTAWGTEYSAGYIKAGGKEVDGKDTTVKDVLLTKDGEYTVSINGIDLSSATSYKLLSIATDMSAKTEDNPDGAYANVKLSNVSLKVDGKVVAENLEVSQKSDEVVYYYPLVNVYDSDAPGPLAEVNANEDLAVPEQSIEITFTVSGLKQALTDLKNGEYTSVWSGEKVKNDTITQEDIDASADNSTPVPTVQPSEKPNVTPAPTNSPAPTKAPTNSLAPTKAPTKGAKVESGKVVYKVTKAATAKKAGTLSLVGLSKAGKKASSLSAPATAKINGYNYKVTSIGKNAFKGANAKTISLSKNIKSIPAGAFANCKKLSTLKVKAKLTKVAKKAFKGCKKKIKVKGASKKITKANVKKLKKSGYKKFK